jgi:hypothetical protein
MQKNVMIILVIGIIAAVIGTVAVVAIIPAQNEASPQIQGKKITLQLNENLSLKSKT